MKDLQIQYSEEIARELGKIAVYLPGEKIDVGDIIKFPNAKPRLFGKKLPLGSFKKITTLENLGVKFKTPPFSGSPDTYRFSSKNEVNIGFNLKGNAELGNESLPKASKDLQIQFSSEGAIFFLAVDCEKQELDDILFLEKEIDSKGKQLVWDDTYLVTSVTVAKKAFVAQSKSKSSEIILTAGIDGFKSSSADISANTNLKISKSKGNLFIKDWSKDVTVFMDLVRFEKKIFQSMAVSEQTRSDTNKLKLSDRRIDIKQELLNNK